MYDLLPPQFSSRPFQLRKFLFALFVFGFSPFLFAQEENELDLSMTIQKFNAGNYNGTLIDLQQVIEQHPNNSRAYLFLGRSYLNLKEYRAAMIHLNRSIELTPSAMGFKERGKLKALMEDYRGSIDDFNQAIALDSTFSDALYNRGLSYLQLGDNQDAVSDFSQVISWNPKDYEAYFQRGRALIALDKKAEGCKDLSKSAELGNFDAYETIKEKCN